MIEGARNNDPRMMNMDYAQHRRPYDEYDAEDDNLDNYLAVEDADMVTVDRSFGMGNEYQYGKNFTI